MRESGGRRDRMYHTCFLGMCVHGYADLSAWQASWCLTATHGRVYACACMGLCAHMRGQFQCTLRIEMHCHALRILRALPCVMHACPPPHHHHPGTHSAIVRAGSHTTGPRRAPHKHPPSPSAPTPNRTTRCCLRGPHRRCACPAAAGWRASWPPTRPARCCRRGVRARTPGLRAQCCWRRGTDAAPAHTAVP